MSQSVYLSNDRVVCAPATVAWWVIVSSFPIPLVDLLQVTTIPDRLQAVELLPGWGVISVMGIRYLSWNGDSTLGYSEFSFCVPVMPNDEAIATLPYLTPALFPQFGLWIEKIVVSTAEGQALGALWGLNHKEAHRNVKTGSNPTGYRYATGVAADGTFLGQIVQQNPWVPVFGGSEFTLWSVVNRRLCSSRFMTRGRVRRTLLPGGTTLTLGRHPYASQLASTGMKTTALPGSISVEGTAELGEPAPYAAWLRLV